MDKIDLFGKILMNDVRDNSIFILDSILNGKAKSERARELNKEISQYSPEIIELIRKLAISSIDNTIHNFLFMFEQSMEYKIIDSEERNITECSDGLCGELYTDDGWIKKYSDYPSSL